MITARILDATRYPEGIMLHLDAIPSFCFHHIKIADTIYKASMCQDMGKRLSINAAFPADYFYRHNIAEFIED